MRRLDARSFAPRTPADLAVICAALLLALSIEGCARRTRTVIIHDSAPQVVAEETEMEETEAYATEAPPELKKEERSKRPKETAVWVPGYWRWHARAYHWVPGHWDLHPGGRAWVAGHWTKRPRGWVWVPGHWRR